MKPRYVFSLLLVTVGSVARASEQTAPFLAVREFIAALNAGSGERASVCVYRSGRSSIGFTMIGGLALRGIQITARNPVTKITGNKATVKLALTFDGGPGDVNRVTETLHLIRPADRWLIVPTEPEKIDSEKPSLGAFASLLAYVDAVERSRRARKAREAETACLGNLNQLVHAIREIAKANNGKLALTERSFGKQVFKILNNEAVLRCGDGPSGVVDYAFNNRLSGRLLARISHPKQTLLLFEGGAQTLRFMHGGKAAVAFADGRCVLVSKSDAAKLKWNP